MRVGFDRLAVQIQEEYHRSSIQGGMKFINVQAAAASACAWVLNIISDVYRAEASAKTSEVRLAVRQARTQALLEELFVFFEACMLKTLPKSPFAQPLSQN